MNKPRIRFKGYTNDWEQRKLGDVTELKSASRVHKGEWTDSGVPFFRSSDVMAAINGTTNEKAYISEELYQRLSSASGKLEEGDVLVTGGGSVGNPYIVPNNEPLYTKDADLLWIKNQGRFHPYFLYEYFFSPTFRTHLSSISHVGTIAHYTITQLSETPICLPDIEEQIKVGEYFEFLDHLITLHQRKCEQVKKLKKYMLQKMFPQSGKKVPEIRFDGFKNDWEQRKLGDVVQITMGQSPDGSTYSDVPSDYILVQGNADLENGWVKPRVWTTQITKQADVGDLIMSVRAPAGAMGKTAYNAVIGRGVAAIKGNEFIYQLLVKMDKEGYWKKDSTGSTFESLNSKSIKNAEIQLPSNKEQNTIGSYLKNLDHLITLHQRKCEELQKIKKYMLQNMFI